MLGQRSFLRIPQEANISVAIPIIAINFAFFMIQDLIYKINAFKGISVALSKIILQKSPEKSLNIAEVQKTFGEFTPLALEQYKLAPKVWKKLPQHAKAGCLFVQRAFEQSSSETVALWKSKFFPSKHLLSLTGGLGIDEWAWAVSGAEVKSCDIQKELNALVRHNQNLLGVSYLREDTDAAKFLEQHKDWACDWVYIDPDRRQNSDRLGGYWESFQPRVDQLIAEYGHVQPKWLIKLSPMTDFRVLRAALPGKIRFNSIYYQGEVKELLLELDASQEISTERRAISLDSLGGFQIFNDREAHQFARQISPEKSEKAADYIFESHGGIHVLDLQKVFLEMPFMKGLNAQNTLFLSNTPLPVHWGRCKRIVHEFEGSLNAIKRALNASDVQAASVTVRDAKGIRAEVIQEKLNLSESDTHTLFVTKDKKGFRAWLCH